MVQVLTQPTRVGRIVIEAGSRRQEIMPPEVTTFSNLDELCLMYVPPFDADACGDPLDQQGQIHPARLIRNRTPRVCMNIS